MKISFVGLWPPRAHSIDPVDGMLQNKADTRCDKKNKAKKKHMLLWNDFFLFIRFQMEIILSVSLPNRWSTMWRFA